MTEPLRSIGLGPGLTAELDLNPAGELDWRLDGDPAAAGVELVRLISARFVDNRRLAVAAARPKGARGHGDESVTALMLTGTSDSANTAEALLSTEYDADGTVRRAGIELYPADGVLTIRIAADREGKPEVEGRHQTVRMALRVHEIAGRGTYELIDLR